MPLIVANNWSAVVQVALYTAVVLVGTLLPAQLRTLALLVATITVLTYQWFVIRTALGTTGGTALGLVVIDVLLSIAVSRGLDGLLQPGRRSRSGRRSRPTSHARSGAVPRWTGDGVLPRSATDRGC